MNISEAIEILNRNYYQHTWDQNIDADTEEDRMVVPWPGEENEEIMISAHKDVGIFQKFHRHEYFFLNFAFQGDFKALSQSDDQIIEILENDCYMAQPYSGYAVTADPGSEDTIVAILIRRSTFFREFFTPLASNPHLFDFFVTAQQNPKSSTAIYIPDDESSPVRQMIELLCIEYAGKDENSQAILKPLVLALFMQLMRIYEKNEKQEQPPLSLGRQLEQYIRSHCASVTLRELADRFSYHPNYISTTIRRELGKGFSDILLEQRMINALSLLKATTLSVEEIASLTGYSNPSNFYKAFRACYGKTPRDYIDSLEKQNAESA